MVPFGIHVQGLHRGRGCGALAAPHPTPPLLGNLVHTFDFLYKRTHSRRQNAHTKKPCNLKNVFPVVGTQITKPFSWRMLLRVGQAPLLLLQVPDVAWSLQTNLPCCWLFINSGLRSSIIPLVLLLTSKYRFGLQWNSSTTFKEE